MARLIKIIFMIAVVSICSAKAWAVEDDDLSDFIPKYKWDEAGLNKLTDKEQDYLAGELAKLLIGHHSHSHAHDGVAVIALSDFTEKKAREIMKQRRLSKVPLNGASEILVIVGSVMDDPLDEEYDSVCDLMEDADRQFNMVGPDFHLYFYEMNENLEAKQISHETLSDEK
jgi:hypothetical protein